MKKRISAYLTILLAFFCYQTKAQNLAVESFELAPTDLTANTPGTMVYDQNGHVCALIKIETLHDGFTFDVGMLAVSEVKRVGAELWVYVPYGIRKITISHPHLGIVRDYQILGSVEPGRTYIMKLITGTVKQIVEYSPSKQYLRIALNPADAILEIDGKMKSTTDGVYQELLPFGQYKYKAQRQDYHDAEGMIEVSDPDNAHRLNLILKPAFGYLSVMYTSQPDIKDAVVYVDEKLVGKVPVQKLRLSSGTHNIRVMKQLYNAYNDTFVISDEENKVIDPILKPNFAEVTLESVSDAEIFIDGEYKGKGSWKGRLECKSYIFETRKPGHISHKKPYDITNTDFGSTIAIQAPTPLYGSLNISSIPSDAKIYIDGKHVGDTPKYIGRQIVGNYSVKVDLDGYEAQTKKVSVTEGEETAVSFTLQKKAVAVPSTTSTTTSSTSQSSQPVSRSDDLGAPVNLSASGTANCYIVSSPGIYKFRTTKGNSSTRVGSVASAVVLWETFGTDIAPNVGDLIKSVSYSKGDIIFTVASPFKEGNALIAAKDSKGTILWSWHIWLTDMPKEQVYKNNAGTMMDRNLGAISAAIENVGSLGLLYQWGRKDPFLGSSSLSQAERAESTLNWPSPIFSSPNVGTIAYATSHPTTFIAPADGYSGGDWYYPVSSTWDKTRWQSSKTIYDPCPAGWRVPDGGYAGVWVKAKGENSDIHDSKYSNTGMDLSKSYGTGDTIWYPASGYLRPNISSVRFYMDGGNYWSVTTDGHEAYVLRVSQGVASPMKKPSRSLGFSVRCVKE